MKIDPRNGQKAANDLYAKFSGRLEIRGITHFKDTLYVHTTNMSRLQFDKLFAGYVESHYIPEFRGFTVTQKVSRRKNLTPVEPPQPEQTVAEAQAEVIAETQAHEEAKALEEPQPPKPEGPDYEKEFAAFSLKKHFSDGAKKEFGNTEVDSEDNPL